MFRTAALKRVGGYVPGMKVEDWYMNLQLAKHYRFKYVDEVLLSYRWHEANSITDPSYRHNAGTVILRHEKDNHPAWFEKYADKKIRAEAMG